MNTISNVKVHEHRQKQHMSPYHYSSHVTRYAHYQTSSILWNRQSR